jgi:hypothetical protein
LWTGLRDVEGFKYDQTLEELKRFFPSGDQSMEEDGEELLPASVPESIRQMASDRCSMEALGDMIWCVASPSPSKSASNFEKVSATVEYRQGHRQHAQFQHL